MTFKQGSCCWDSAEHPRRKNLLCEFGASLLSQQSDSRYSVVSQRPKAAIFDGNGKGTFSFQAWISFEMCQLCQCSVIASSEVVLLLLGAIFNWLALVIVWGQHWCHLSHRFCTNSKCCFTRAMIIGLHVKSCSEKINSKFGYTKTSLCSMMPITVKIPHTCHKGVENHYKSSSEQYILDLYPCSCPKSNSWGFFEVVWIPCETLTNS